MTYARQARLRWKHLMLGCPLGKPRSESWFSDEPTFQPSKGTQTMSTTFSVWDYVVFSLVLVISVAIGFYHALVGGKQQTTAEFLVADRSLSALPVALSVLASFFSASTLLGTPAEIYLRGTQYWMSVWGAMIAPLVGAFIFGPFLHRLKLVSVFQYLEMRYQSKVARTFGAVLFIIRAAILRSCRLHSWRLPSRLLRSRLLAPVSFAPVVFPPVSLRPASLRPVNNNNNFHNDNDDDDNI
ncbi:Sodium-dependent multivitamin transporter [Lamellibrachia satsuma]|nr:Sodium-dependent multivitamin transporter [Lamellibrachia satsuma]